MMNWKYFCPKCEAHLNPALNIVLKALVSGQQGLLVFSPEPGNYEVALPDGVESRMGQVWEFFCPVCHANITSEENHDLAMLTMTDTAGSQFKVYFTKLEGEHATFVVDTEEVKAFGDDVEHWDKKLPPEW
jgi:hypothetical protein